VKWHWSGKGSLQAAIRSLPGGAALYALGYRHTSSIAHVADFGAQFEVEPRSGDYIWEIEPTLQGFEAPSYAARQLLWHAAHRIDERLGLGFAATLAPFQLTRADVENAHT